MPADQIDIISLMGACWDGRISYDCVKRWAQDCHQSKHAVGAVASHLGRQVDLLDRELRLVALSVVLTIAGAACGESAEEMTTRQTPTSPPTSIAPTTSALPTSTVSPTTTAALTTTATPTTTTIPATTTSASTALSLPTSEYYAQFRVAEGITIEASSAVDPRALDIAVEVVTEMLRGRDDIMARLVEQEAAVAVIPKDSFVTELPEFASLSGRSDRNGNPYDSFAIRGLGAVRGQSVTATSEENLLRLPGDPFRAESVAHHEFAHAVMNIGFTTDDLSRWTQIYEAALQSDTFPGTFAMVHQDEYFAELSQSYFSVNNEIGGPSAVQSGDPAAFSFLQEVYGDL